MEEKNIKAMQVLVKQLSEENELLKQKVNEMKLYVELAEKTYKERTEAAHELVEKCNASKKEFDEAIAAARLSQQKYDEAVQDIAKMKAEYKSKLETMMRQFDN